MHGGWGYMSETKICRSYADARVQTIYGGSNEIIKELSEEPFRSSSELLKTAHNIETSEKHINKVLDILTVQCATIKELIHLLR